MFRLTEPQLSALECAGVFEGEDALARFIKDGRIEVTDESATLVCELSNHLDEIGNGNDLQDDEVRKWHRADARILSNLYSKMLRGMKEAA